MSEPKTLEQQAQQQMFIQTLLLAMPDLPKFFPQIQGALDMIDKSIEGYLGDDEKMIVVVRKNGISRAIVLNPKINFSITNKMELEAEGKVSPVIANYEKNEYKSKLLESGPLQILKERYEKIRSELQHSSPTTINEEPNILSILKNITP